MVAAGSSSSLAGKTMKAAQVLQHGKPLTMVEVPIPQIGFGEVLIKLEVTGVCHTDVHVRDGDWKIKSPLPMTPGHEGVGLVVEVGGGVENMKVGDRVCTPWLHKSCSNCEHCLAGWETVCPSVVNCGFTAHGSFAQYIKAPAAFCGIVPKGLSSEQAGPITCAGVTVYKGLKVSDVKPGQWVVIVGAGGGLGHIACQYARAMGMKVIGVDAGAQKHEFLEKLMQNDRYFVALDAKKCDVIAEVTKLTDNKGAHGALILVPHAPLVQEAVTYLRPRGTVVPIALTPGCFSLNTFDVVVKAITVKGSIVGTRNDLNEAMQIAADGLVKCNVEVRKFSEVNSILADLEKGTINGRVVMDLTKF